MKKLFLFLLFALSFCACEEEKEAPLLFDVIENTLPDITYIGYYSPRADGGGEKWYHVLTDFSENEVKLKCNNCDRTHISCSYQKPYVREDGGSSETEATPEETGIYVSLSEDNVITIRFAELETENNTYGYYGTIYASGKVGGEEKQTIIKLARRNQR